MYNILTLSKTNKLILAVIAFLAVLALGSNRAHAAALNVSGGCTLPIAIDSVNAGADQAGCTASGSYGSSDAIILPAGTITLTADLPTITAPVTINGAGMGQTIIDGDSGDYAGFSSNDVSVRVSDLRIQGYDRYAIDFESSNVQIEDVEIDGQNAENANQNITIYNNSGDDRTVFINNVYMHDITGDDSRVLGIYVTESSGATTTATFTNITLADISATAGVLNGFNASAETAGVMNASASNITVNNLESNSLVAPFSGFALASGGNASVNFTVTNATITGSRGFTGASPPVTGAKSAAFYAATMGQTSGDSATAVVRVNNSLLADNLNDGVSSNCSVTDLTPVVGGAGTGTPSINSLGYNISDDASCTSFTQPGDQQNVNHIISTLGPLQNNGGAVPTRALLASSPAIASGGAVLGVTTDARGVARPNTCPSVGAFQFEGAVCGASTPAASAGSSGGKATAPNTGIGSSSLAAGLVTGLLGLGIVVSLVRKKIAIQ